MSRRTTTNGSTRLAPRSCSSKRARRLGAHRRAAVIGLFALLACPAIVAAQQDTAERKGPRFDFSGVQRTRYEALDPQFRAGFDESDDVLAFQTSLFFDLKLEHWQLYAEIMDSRAELNDEHSFVNGTVVDALEPIQAYVAWSHEGFLQPNSQSTLRVGRVTLDLGKRRVLARNRYRNTVNNFIGADWLWRGSDSRNLRLFYFMPMRPLPTDLDGLLDNELELDRATRDSAVFGAFYQLPPFADKSVLEVYVLKYDVDPPPNDLASASDRFTIGARAYRPPSPGAWNYEAEAIWQEGTAGGTEGSVPEPDLDNRAYFLHLELGYAFDVGWRPNLMFQYDLATGDEDPNDASLERFNTLFGARRFDWGPTGIYGPIARSNIESPGLRLTYVPKPRWQGMAAFRVLKLDEARDQWVGSGWRDPTGQSGKSIGKQLETSFTWAAIKDRLSVETGFAVIDLGRFAEQVQGPALRGDPRYFYAAVTTSF